MQNSLVIALFAVCFVSAHVIPLNRLPHLPLTPELKFEQRTIDSAVAPLGGSVATLGEFYATITLGTPPQTLNVQVDTGSSDLLVFGRLCTECASNVTYAAIHSTSYTAVPCNADGYTCRECSSFLQSSNVCSFSDYYGDGSGVNGSVLTDVMSFSSFNNINVSFGYILNSTGGFEHNPVDGIWGVSYPDLAITTPAIDSLFKQGDVYRGFSLCLSPAGSDVPSSMTIGKPQAATSSFEFTPVVQEEYYNVKITDMQVNGKSIGVAPGVFTPAIVDSGTTLWLVPQKAFAALYKSVSATPFCKSNGQDCDAFFNNGSCISGISMSDLPTISMVLSGISTPLSVGPEVYTIAQPYEGRTYTCLGIMSSGDIDFTILGDTFMGAFNVFFDVENSQIGFADPSTCPTSTELLI